MQQTTEANTKICRPEASKMALPFRFVDSNLPNIPHKTTHKIISIYQLFISNSSKQFLSIESNKLNYRIRSCRILFNGFRSEENLNFAHTNYAQRMHVAVKTTEPPERRSSQSFIDISRIQFDKKKKKKKIN